MCSDLTDSIYLHFHHIPQTQEEIQTWWINRTIEEKKIFNGMMSHMRQRHKNVTVTEEDLYKMILKQGNRCIRTGIPFEWKRHSPRLLSVDRINPKSPDGYSLSNIQLVVYSFNRLKNEWA